MQVAYVNITNRIEIGVPGMAAGATAVAPTLYVNDVSSGVSVTVSTATAGRLVLTHGMTGRTPGDVLRYEGGTVVVNGQTLPMVVDPHVADVLVSSRLAPATANRLLSVDTSGRVDLGGIVGNTFAVGGLYTLAAAYASNGYVSADAVRWGGALVGGMPLAPATPGRTLAVDASGIAAADVKLIFASNTPLAGLASLGQQYGTYSYVPAVTGGGDPLPTSAQVATLLARVPGTVLLLSNYTAPATTTQYAAAVQATLANNKIGVTLDESDVTGYLPSRLMRVTYNDEVGNKATGLGQIGGMIADGGYLPTLFDRPEDRDTLIGTIVAATRDDLERTDGLLRETNSYATGAAQQANDAANAAASAADNAAAAVDAVNDAAAQATQDATNLLQGLQQVPGLTRTELNTYGVKLNSAGLVGGGSLFLTSQYTAPPTAGQVAESTRQSLERTGGPLLEAAADALSAKTNAQTAAAKATAVENRVPLVPASKADVDGVAGGLTDGDREKLNAIHGRLPSNNQFIAGTDDAQGKPPGAGADPLTCTFVIPTTPVQPVADADAWITRDAAGTQVVDAGQTDTDGRVTFLVDGFVSPGSKRTFYFFAQRDGLQSVKAAPVVCD